MESLLIATHNNAIRINCVKTKTDNTRKNGMCKLCDDRGETVNHITSECNKIVQKKYKTRHDLVGKVIYLNFCKRLKHDHCDKWYMHKPESVL